jgi:dUTP pyrophosphatase
MSFELKVKRIRNDAKLPSYGHKGDAGLDLFTSVNAVIETGQILSVPTGIKVAIPEGHVGLIWDKSGVSLRGVHRLAGVIDSGYRGEVKVVLVNLGHQAYSLEKGMKIAQLIIQPVNTVTVTEVRNLGDTPRGEGGFGSTGEY